LAADGANVLLLWLSLGLLFACLIGLAVFARYFGLWIQCRMTGAEISLTQLMLMSLRKVNPSIIAHSKIMAVQAGITSVYPISTKALQAHYLAGGNVPRVIKALIAAYRAHIRWGRIIFDYAHTTNPKPTFGQGVQETATFPPRFSFALSKPMRIWEPGGVQWNGVIKSCLLWSAGFCGVTSVWESRSVPCYFGNSKDKSRSPNSPPKRAF
jgi:hypothetical protein